VLWMGWRAVPEFVAQSAGNLSYWETWPAVTFSLRGVVARMLIGSQWSRAVIHAPRVATAIALVSSVALIAIAVYTTVRHSRTQHGDDLLFAIWSILLLPLNPLAMGHNGVLLALPIVLIGRVLATDPSTSLKVLWAIGCVLVSIPRQAIFDPASIPVSPLHSLTIVALPLWGTLLLFATAVAVANRNERSGRPALSGHPSVSVELF